ncbi:hypothetical protein V8E36_003478 [Tilletia maclaganii]
MASSIFLPSLRSLTRAQRGSHSRLVNQNNAFLLLQLRAASTSATPQEQPPKRRVVVLGSGWAGYQIARDLDKTKNEVIIVSPSTNFSFTPLLAGVCVGALDYRSAIEPVREIRDAQFLHSWVDAIDTKNATVTLVPAYPRALNEERFAETRGGFNTAFVRPAHRRPVETAEGDALNPISPFVPAGARTAAGAQLASSAPGAEQNGAFSPSRSSSAQPVVASSAAAQSMPQDASSSSASSYASSSSSPGAVQLAGHDSYGPSETWASQERGRQFKIGYDALVIAVGSFNRTFTLKGVKSNAWFLKDIQNARSIRFRLFECLEQASALHLNDTERSRLLQWVIVGGGPTGSELAAELVDLKEDIKKLYPKLAPLIQITLLDSAPGILNTFHDRLSQYARAKFHRDGINMMLNRTVKEVKKGRIVVEGDGEIPFSLMVWCTGNCPSLLIKKLGGKSERPDVDALGADAEAQGWASMAIHERTSQLLIDDHLRVLAPPASVSHEGSSADGSSAAEANQIVPGVFAIGDCSTLQSGVLPATAQVAAQQAKHLAKLINALPPSSSSENGAASSSLAAIERGPKFKFQNRGIMASVGTGQAIVQFPPSSEDSTKARDLAGRPAWLAWRSAYTLMSLSWRNKVAVPLNWLMTGIFGRDIARF